MTLASRVQRDVGVAPEPVDPAEHGVVRAGAAADDVDHRQPDGDDERLQHAGDDDARGGDGGDRDLDAVDVASARQAAGSTRPIAAVTITAPSTAFGR